MKYIILLRSNTALEKNCLLLKNDSLFITTSYNKSIITQHTRHPEDQCQVDRVGDQFENQAFEQSVDNAAPPDAPLTRHAPGPHAINTQKLVS